ncbi:hypothetical protein psyc5s11_23430 [Clostridium gelidum]|uniref:Autolysin n=1 Tax=Clostridium gelidum TaxID=704125 RepID=A0ABN6IZY2_9CLOT|nr:cell wall-binding protein [Clostridium gelidum]BCZ46276.1 hypothetical protein psyc5s11_23430 [Clostridium gelidum]
MKKLKLTKIIANSLLIVSALALNPMGASAQWKQDSNGWWNTEGNSWSVGWRLIDGKWYYFEQDGYMKTGWIKYDGRLYYLNTDGSMAHDTTIDGFTVGSDGKWNQYAGTSSLKSSSNINPNSTVISDVTGVKFDDITKIVFYDGRGRRNGPVMIEDKQKIKEFMGYLDGCSIKKTKNLESTGWIHSAVFYINDKEVMNITFVNPIIINGDYFNITKGELDSETIGKFLKSIDPSYDIMAGL